jgi:drug/metabolite transporter (DMT)-like permease
LSSVCAFLFEDWQKAIQPEILFQREVVIALIVTSFLATAFAFLVQTYFQKYTSATHTALIFASEPVFAAFTAFLFAGERMSSGGIIGSIFILLGMIFAELPSKRKKSAENTIQEKAV